MANIYVRILIQWLKQATAWAAGVAAVVIPLYFVLKNDRDLQRTELGITDQHAAYTDVLNAADAVIVPRYASWLQAEDMGIETPRSWDETAALAAGMSRLFPDEGKSTRTFQDAATRLRLVIPADDAHLISQLAYTLDPRTVTFEGVELTPSDLLTNYTDAKLKLVNEFRTDVLGQDELPDDETVTMKQQTLDNIRWETEFRDANPQVPPTAAPGGSLGLAQETGEGPP